MRILIRQSFALAILLLVFKASTAQAEINQPSIPQLTAQDYAEIEQLYARYMHDYSTANRDGKDFAALFTEDGIYVCPHCHTDVFIYYSGSDALATYATGTVLIGPTTTNPEGDGVAIRTLPPNGGKGPNNIDHVVSNIFIEAVSGGVAVRASFLAVDSIGLNGASHVRPGGVFFDILVKSEAGWRFKRKQYLFRGAPVPASIAPPFRDFLRENRRN